MAPKKTHQLENPLAAPVSGLDDQAFELLKDKLVPDALDQDDTSTLAELIDRMEAMGHSSWHVGHLLESALRANASKCLGLILQRTRSPCPFPFFGISHAITRGNPRITYSLVERLVSEGWECPPHPFEDSLMKDAISIGNLECAKRMLPISIVPHSARNGRLILDALMQGHVKIAKLLTPRGSVAAAMSRNYHMTIPEGSTRLAPRLFDALCDQMQEEDIRAASWMFPEMKLPRIHAKAQALFLSAQTPSVQNPDADPRRL